MTSVSDPRLLRHEPDCARVITDNFYAVDWCDCAQVRFHRDLQEGDKPNATD